MNWFDTIRIVAAGVGLFYNSIILYRSINDVENVKDDPLARESAVVSVLIFLGGTITQLTFFITGIMAVLFRSPVDAVDIIFITSSVISGVLARIIYVRRRTILVTLYKDQHELRKYRKTDKEDLKEYRQIDKQDPADYREADDK